MTDSLSHDEQQAYDQWFRQRVTAAMDDKRPALSHQEVMEEVQRLIDRKAKRDSI